MGEKKVVNAMVSGGEASAGPPLGPALGPLGINILQVVNSINEKTRDFPGMKVPVKVEVDSETKKFEVEVGIPPTAALLFKESGITKGSGTAGTNFAGNVSMDSILKVSKTKLDISYATTLKSCCKEIIGSCLSHGMKVEDKMAKEVYKDIDSGKYDSLFQ